MKGQNFIFLIAAFITLCCCSPENSNSRPTNNISTEFIDSLPLKVYDISKLFHEVKDIPIDNYILTDDLSSIVFVSGDHIYKAQLEDLSVDSIAINNLLGDNSPKAPIYRIAYFSSNNHLCIFCYDRNSRRGGFDSIFVLVTRSDLSLIKKITIPLRHEEFSDDLALQKIHTVSEYNNGFILTSFTFAGLTIDGGELNYPKNKSGNRILYDAVTRNIISITPFFDKNGRKDYAILNDNNPSDTLVIASEDSVLKSVPYIGNPLLVNGKLIFRHGLVYHIDQHRWINVSSKELMHLTKNGEWFYLINKSKKTIVVKKSS